MTEQVQMGKAFEYALATSLNEMTNAPIALGPYLATAQDHFHDITLDRPHMKNAASEAVNFLMAHDPRLQNANSISLQNDSTGKKGDVRDIVITTKTQEIGISAKHNHQAIKHSRLSDNIDFGDSWGNHPVSNRYWKSVRPIFNDLRKREMTGQLFRNLRNKSSAYYLPVLTAFEDELRRLCEDYGRQFITPFFRYLLGTNDYYLVSCQPYHVYIQSTNINGSLKWGRKWKVPEAIEQIRRKRNSDNTLLVTFAGGWQISFRIHNARAIVEPSLKFDIQFIGLPQNVARHEIPLSN